MRIYENIHFIIDNKYCWCDNGLLNPMKTIKVKYIPEKLYNRMKEILTKYWKRRGFWDYIQLNIFLI